MSAGRNLISKNKEWGTPQKYVDAVKEFFRGSIDLDPCSNQYSIVNAKVEYRLPEQDGLMERWDYPKIYVNPPYGIDKERGTSIKNWLYQCHMANVVYNSAVIALIPVATNTSHWKRHVFGAASRICFLSDTRLHFLENGENVGKGAPMACAMVLWCGKDVFKAADFDEVFKKHGAVVNIMNLIDERWEKKN